MRLRINAAGVSLTLEAATAEAMADLYTTVLTAPTRLRELLTALELDDDEDDDDGTGGTQGGPDPDGDGGTTADVDRLLAQVGISTG